MRRLRVPILVLLALVIGYVLRYQMESSVPLSSESGSLGPGAESASPLSEIADDSVAAERSLQGVAEQPRREIADDRGMPTRDSNLSAELLPSERARLQSERDAARVRLQEIESELLALDLAARPVVSPIPLGPEFDWIYEQTYRGLFHEEFQREPIDPAWAAATEARLQSFIYARPGIVQKYGAPTIRCHSTRCEVTFLAYGIDDDPSVTYRDVRTMLDDAVQQIEGAFDCYYQCQAGSNNAAGAATLFWGVSRADEASRARAARRNATD